MLESAHFGDSCCFLCLGFAQGKDHVRVVGEVLLYLVRFAGYSLTIPESNSDHCGISCAIWAWVDVGAITWASSISTLNELSFPVKSDSASDS